MKGIPTQIRAARERNVQLPSRQPEELARLYVKSETLLKKFARSERFSATFCQIRSKELPHETLHTWVSELER